MSLFLKRASTRHGTHREQRTDGGATLTRGKALSYVILPNGKKKYFLSRAVLEHARELAREQAGGALSKAS